MNTNTTRTIISTVAAAMLLFTSAAYAENSVPTPTAQQTSKMSQISPIVPAKHTPHVLADDQLDAVTGGSPLAIIAVFGAAMACASGGCHALGTAIGEAAGYLATSWVGKPLPVPYPY